MERLILEIPCTDHYTFFATKTVAVLFSSKKELEDYIFTKAYANLEKHINWMNIQKDYCGDLTIYLNKDEAIELEFRDLWHVNTETQKKKNPIFKIEDFEYISPRIYTLDEWLEGAISIDTNEDAR